VQVKHLIRKERGETHILHLICFHFVDKTQAKCASPNSFQQVRKQGLPINKSSTIFSHVFIFINNPTVRFHGAGTEEGARQAAA